MGTHTPGPWIVEQRGSRNAVQNVVVAPGTGTQLGRFGNGGGSRGNAYLIAAAPELLEAAKAALELVKVARNHFPKSVRDSDRFQLENINAVIGAAVAKAEGQA